MNRTPVTSSRIKSIGHEGDILEVEFHRGGIYQYSPIDAEAAKNLTESQQVGVDIQAIINNPTINCKKL